MLDQLANADYVIVGAGSAGCVLANRLSEDPKVRVVLLEAGGGGDARFLVQMPVGVYRLMADSRYNWLYATEPDPSLNDRVSAWSAGRLLGGGSSINGMVYIRGARHDYDQWAQEGCGGWGWDDVLPYFKKSETFEGPAGESHGKSGPLRVSNLRIKHPLADAFVDACAHLGLRRIEDYCAGDIDGAFVNLATQHRGQRWSAARGYLRPAMGRPNLAVVTGAMADRVIVEDGRAIGVAFEHQGRVQRVMARREVILSAGAVQSPTVLMRSGIGPGRHLADLGIEVKADAPGVGANLQEHASIPMSQLVDTPTYNTMVGSTRLPAHVAQYLALRRGLLTTTPVHAMAFLRSDQALPHPDIKLQFGPAATDMETRGFAARPGFTVFVNVSPPKSRGEIRLRSAKPSDRPVIDHRLFGHPDDMRAMISGLKQVERLFEAPPLARHIVGRNFPAQLPADDEAWAETIRARAGVGFHLVGTCRMGSDPASVVDPSLRVRGVAGLRVADCSIMPRMPTANTNAPAIMVGEKAADLIRAHA